MLEAADKVPLAVKELVVEIAPPALIAPLTPMPPVTTKAPLVLPVDAVPEFTVTDPELAAGPSMILPDEFAIDVTPEKLEVEVVTIVLRVGVLSVK